MAKFTISTACTLKVTYYFFFFFFFPAGVLKMSYGRDGSEDRVKGRI